jgi:hypothetical protein
MEDGLTRQSRVATMSVAGKASLPTGQSAAAKRGRATKLSIDTELFLAAGSGWTPEELEEALGRTSRWLNVTSRNLWAAGWLLLETAVWISVMKAQLEELKAKVGDLVVEGTGCTCEKVNQKER